MDPLKPCFILLIGWAAFGNSVLQAAERTMNVTTLRDKISGGWVGHMAGVSWGAPTEFGYQGTMIPDASVPVWSPSWVNGGYGQDDLYVQMPFVNAMKDNGANCDWTKFGDYFRVFAPQLWHANMQGRQNLQNGFQVPDSGHYSHNQHCDDIDWQIESNFGGIMTPGQPNAAAELAWRAGHTMNYGDGVYGGVFVAAMHAEAYFATNVQQVIEAGRQAIPAGSKYRQVIEDVIAWNSQGKTWQQSWQLLQNKWGTTDRCPDGVNNPFNIDAKLNGAYVLIGLLYGGGDFELSVRIAMQCGQDSDFNPGSVGAVLGTFYGLSCIPSKFTSALNTNSMFSGTAYTVGQVTAISESMARQILALTGGSTSGTGLNETWTIPWSTPTPLILEQWPISSNAPPSLTAALVTQTNLTVTLRATAADSEGISGYQWFFGDMSFTNGANVTHTYQQHGVYSVICYAADNLGNTSYRALTVYADTNPPVLLGMEAAAGNQVRVTYSKAVEPASATNLSHYAITPGIAVLGAAFGLDAKTVLLTTSPLAIGMTYTGLVWGVSDLAVPPNTIASNSQATFIRINPLVLAAMEAAAGNQVRVTYSEAVEPASATNQLNYTITPGITVLGAAFGLDAKTVVLRTAPLAIGITYTGLVSGVRDLAVPSNTIASNSQATFILLPFTVWHSYDATLSAGPPQGRVFDESGLVAADLEFYESTNNGGVSRGALFSTFNPGAHPEGFNAVGTYWANGSGPAYPYAGKSLVARSAAEGNAPAPLGVMDLQLHPPQNDHLVVAAFVVHFAGTYRLTDLGARRRVTSGNSVVYRVFDNNELLVATLRAGNNTVWTTDTNVYWLGRLAAGDRVFFTVDRDGDYGWDATEVAWTLSAQTERVSGGSLSCSRAAIPPTVDLTTEGTVDWAHWGLNSAASFDHKRGVPSRISNYRVIGSAGAQPYSNNPNAYAWADGTPTASNPGTSTGVYVGPSVGGGFQFAVPADMTLRTLKLYVGVWAAQGKLELSLSDGSAPAFSDNSLQNSSSTSTALYTIHFRAASAGQTLVVKWTTQALLGGTNIGNLTLQAAALGLASLEPWRASYFSAAELADPSISGDTADPDGDGIPNLLEYALNGDPRTANGSIKPKPSITDDHLTMSYIRRKAPTDVTYDLQVSSDVAGGWTSTGISEQILTDDGGLQTVRVTDPALAGDNGKRFFKLKVGRQ